MTTQLKKAAEEYVKDFLVSYNEGVFLTEVYPGEVRTYSYDAFLAGARYGLEVAAGKCDEHHSDLKEMGGKPACMTTCLVLREAIRAVAKEGEND